ncbi:MAG: transcriptional regulator PpsR [Thermaurantiacus sp.]
MPTPPPEPRTFRRGGTLLGALDAEETARLAGAAGDVALVLDPDGIIRDVAVGISDIPDDGVAAWLDRPLEETVTPESRAKVRQLLQGVDDDSEARWRQVNQILSVGSEPGGTAGAEQMPVRYLALKAGREGAILAVGRDMRPEAMLQQRLLQAQQSMERDYLRLRQAESRYRLLFEVSREAVLVIDTGSRRIVEANPAAAALVTARDRAGLSGQPFLSLFPPGDQDAAVALLATAGQGDQARSATLHVGPQAVQATVSASLFRQDRTTLCLLRLTPLATGTADDTAQARTLQTVLERMPDGFVLADRRFRILAANSAFLDLAEAASREQVAGLPLENFLGRPGIDLGLLETQLREHGAVRNFATQVRGRLGAEEQVEISAVAVPHEGETVFGFAVRATGRRLLEAPAEDLAVPRSVEQLTELVGRVSLKEIVRESTDLIERLCIEAALNFTSNNRASAAEMLGLSRQSLYSKLRRHGLGNLAIDFD